MQHARIVEQQAIAQRSGENDKAGTADSSSVARDTIHTVKDATREATETAPTTIKTLKEVSDKVSSKVTENSS